MIRLNYYTKQGLPDIFPILKIEEFLVWYKITNGCGVMLKTECEIL